MEQEFQTMGANAKNLLTILGQDHTTKNTRVLWATMRKQKEETAATSAVGTIGDQPSTRKKPRTSKKRKVEVSFRSDYR